MPDHDPHTDDDVAEFAAEIDRLRTELDRLQALSRPIDIEGRLVQDEYTDVDGTITIRGRIFTETGVWRAEQVERRTSGSRWVSMLAWPERPREAERVD